MRLRRDETVADDQVAARRAWCLRVLELPERSPQRAEAVQAMQVALGLSKTQCYAALKQFRENGTGGLQRKPRKDAGNRRTLTLDEAAAWLDYATHPKRNHWPVALRISKYREFLLASHQQTLDCSDATLQRVLADADPAFGQTKKDRKWGRQRILNMGVLQANGVWQADQMQADVVVQEVDLRTGEIREFRPLLFHFVDMMSGAFVGGFYVRGNHQSYSDSVVEAAMLDSFFPSPDGQLPYCGTPHYIYWDNAKSHKSGFITRICDTLSIRLSNNIPKNHFKFIEGVHNFLHSHFEATLPGYVGGDNRERNRPLARRMEDEGECAPERLMTLGELNEAWHAWKIEVQHAAYNEGASRLSRWLGSTAEHPDRRAIPDWHQLGWEMMRIAEREVRGGAVELRSVTYVAPHLAEWDGLRVEVRYLEGWFRQVVICHAGEVIGVGEPAERYEMFSDESYAALKQRNKEGREALASIDESAALLRATGAHELAAQVEAERRKLKPQQAAAYREHIERVAGGATDVLIPTGETIGAPDAEPTNGDLAEVIPMPFRRETKPVGAGVRPGQTDPPQRVAELMDQFLAPADEADADGKPGSDLAKWL